MSEEFDFESIKNKALEQLKSGKPLLGKDGAFAPLLESILNAALEGEMDAHLSEDERMSGNRRNGKMQKQVQTSMGEVTVSTPRDRNSTFDPQFIKKRETILAEGVADRIIGLYALGNSTREISDWMEENLGNRVSAETISAITDRVLPEIKAWRSRSLDSVYPIVWMDAIHYKVMDDRGCAVTRAIYNVLALDSEGHKDLLGMYISKNEGANFWLNVLTDLQTRGVCDILIACVDGLKGFPDAIQSVFPDTIVQLCIVHQIRNSVKYVGSKHQKEFMRDLKHVYGAVNKESAETELLNLEEKWGEKYPIVIKSWQDNWERLTEYFQFTPDIRRMIYTTNTVEGYHRQIRKVTKNKGVFPNNTALEKLVYLAYRNIRKKWTMPLANWAAIAQQLAIKFARFEYSGMETVSGELSATDTLRVNVRVKNTGSRAGSEVVQLYVRDLISSVATPVRQLHAFDKVELNPGEERSVRFSIPVPQLSLYDADMRRIVEPGDFELQVGASSRDIRLRDTVTVAGCTDIPDPKATGVKAGAVREPGAEVEISGTVRNVQTPVLLISAM